MESQGQKYALSDARAVSTTWRHPLRCLCHSLLCSCLFVTQCALQMYVSQDEAVSWMHAKTFSDLRSPQLFTCKAGTFLLGSYGPTEAQFLAIFKLLDAAGTRCDSQPA